MDSETENGEILDRLIDQLRYRHATPYGAGLKAKEIADLIQMSTKSFLVQKTLLDIEPPITVCGDLHGQYNDLLFYFDANGWPPTKRYLFLGDYVDRGPRSIECMTLLFALKVRYPDAVYLLRGNHECRAINRTYGFLVECMERYCWDIWDRFQHAFRAMPLCALIKGRIFCMHGGIPRYLRSFDDIREVKRPIEIPARGILCDLLWSDPKRGLQGWAQSGRGAGHLFGEDAVMEFCRQFDIDLVIRAHQLVQRGYRFFANKHLVTIFSAPNYAGTYTNWAAMVKVDENLKCRFKQTKRPVKRRHSSRKKRPKKPKQAKPIVEEETDEEEEDSTSEEEEGESPETANEKAEQQRTKWVERALTLLDEMLNGNTFHEYHPGQPKLPKSWPKTAVGVGEAHLSYRGENRSAKPIEITVTVHKRPEISLHLKAHEFIDGHAIPFEYQMDHKPAYSQDGEEADNALKADLRSHFFDKVVQEANSVPPASATNESSESPSAASFGP